ncbi:MAG TPA: pyridine nucleotide-disulfide oxidoreductase, partial [Synergistaceae bacterium]|nr:pyridine nucleotide-disulfide oxidoreductase [Synergistaceae bacterium]
TMPDALAMKSAVDSGRVKSAVIVGGGLIGMEVVEALANRGISVSVVDLLPTPLPALVEEDFGLRIQKYVEGKGVHFYGGEKVVEIVGDGGVVSAVRTDKRTIDADMVLMAVGIRPNTAMAKEAGLELAKNGTIVVDDSMRTSDPHIYAGGDCVQTKHLVTGKPVWQPMGSTANRQGRVIADAIAGLRDTFAGVIGTGILKLFELTIGRTGLNDAQAREAGYDPVSVLVHEPDRPHFMPGMGAMSIRLVADRNSRQILGAQLMGNGAVDKRLDALVAAITGRLTVDLLADTDFAYAPPFSTALDPITHAANVLRNKMDGLVRTYSPEEMAERMATGTPPFILDVRTPKELDLQGRLPYDSVNIPLGTLRARVGELPKGQEIVVYCKTSGRAWDAISALKIAGFEDTAILEGGITAWPYEIK